MRPFISETATGVHFEQSGYMIGGSQHKLGCRCYACRVVRMRAREKRNRFELFNCG